MKKEFKIYESNTPGGIAHYVHVHKIAKEEIVAITTSPGIHCLYYYG